MDLLKKIELKYGGKVRPAFLSDVMDVIENASKHALQDMRQDRETVESDETFPKAVVAYIGRVAAKAAGTVEKKLDELKGVVKAQGTGIHKLTEELAEEKRKYGRLEKSIPGIVRETVNEIYAGNGLCVKEKGQTLKELVETVHEAAILTSRDQILEGFFEMGREYQQNRGKNPEKKILGTTIEIYEIFGHRRINVLETIKNCELIIKTDSTTREFTTHPNSTYAISVKDNRLSDNHGGIILAITPAEQSRYDKNDENHYDVVIEDLKDTNFEADMLGAFVLGVISKYEEARQYKHHKPALSGEALNKLLTGEQTKHGEYLQTHARSIVRECSLGRYVNPKLLAKE